MRKSATSSKTNIRSKPHAEGLAVKRERITVKFEMLKIALYTEQCLLARDPQGLPLLSIPADDMLNQPSVWGTRCRCMEIVRSFGSPSVECKPSPQGSNPLDKGDLHLLS